MAELTQKLIVGAEKMRQDVYYQFSDNTNNNNGGSNIYANSDTLTNHQCSQPTPISTGQGLTDDQLDETSAGVR